MENSIIRWSWIATVDQEDYLALLRLCRNEFADIRFKAVYYCQNFWWIEALLEHERGCGWGSRTGEYQPEIRKYAETMMESLKRKRKAANRKV